MSEENKDPMEAAEKQAMRVKHRAYIDKLIEDGKPLTLDDLFLPDGTFALTPLGDRIYITIPIEQKEKELEADVTAGGRGIQLPKSVHFQDTALAQVICVGKGLVTVDEEHKVHQVPVQVDAREWVMFPEQHIAKIRFHGIEVGLIRENDILAIVDPMFVGVETSVIAFQSGYGNPDINDANRAPGYL